jgi:3-oxoacyl-(acyl-carrier-protein) synthase
MPLLPDRIVVTATGIITALGTGQREHAAGLQNNKSVLRHPQVLQTIHASEFVVGEVPYTNEALLAKLGFGADAPPFTRTALVSLCAMQNLIANSDLGYLQRSGERLAFINANTVGGMSEVENLYMNFLKTTEGSEEAKWIDTLDCAESTEQVAKYFGLSPQMATISTACSSSANSMILGARMLRLGLADVVIAGGSDALSRFTLNGFNSLKNVDRVPCRPFDGTRNGLNLGEGAAYLVMEREGDAMARGANAEAVFSGWCNANDAYHPTAPSPDGSGALRAMVGALAEAALEAKDIDYINAHGTATLNNDLAEGRAIETLWGGTPPPFSSTKPFTGHTLAAAGAVEAILCIYAMQESMVPVNMNWSVAMEELEIRPMTEPVSRKMKHVMSNSFGFGGNNVSLILSKA